jgi:DNA-binding IclR family transcriptional regulator
MMKASFKPELPPTVPGTRAVQRALSLLKAFSDEEPRRSLTELAVEVGLDKATAHRMLKALELEGFVTRSPGTGDYQLGSEMIVLGTRALRAVDVREAARPELEFLADATGETASLESLAHGEVLILDEARGRGILSIGTEIGTRWPAHATATGKVLMAFAEPDIVLPPGSLAAITDNTITSQDQWAQALAEIRELGYATNLEELEYGYASVAAAVRDRDGKTTAALSVGGSVHRVTPDRIPALAEEVKAAAARLSGHLGHRSDLPGTTPTKPS